MILNLALLLVVAVFLVRTISYCIYCFRKSLVGGVGVLVLCLGIAFCGVVVYLGGVVR